MSTKSESSPGSTAEPPSIDSSSDGRRSLRIDLDTRMKWSAYVRSIGKACSRMGSVHFDCRSGRAVPVGLRLDAFANLKSVSFGPAGTHAAPASVFRSIPPSIESVVGLAGMKGEYAFGTAAELEAFFAKQPLLKEVRLGALLTRDRRKADIFRVIADRCKQLKKIDIAFQYYDTSVADMVASAVDEHGVVALASMKELKLRDAQLSVAEAVEICERSKSLEILSLCLAPSDSPPLRALTAVAELRELHELEILTDSEISSAPTTRFVHWLVRNSGASLRRLELGRCSRMSLSTAAIEELANGVPNLRRFSLPVRGGRPEPEAIRLLIDSIVGHASWIPLNERLEVQVHVYYESTGRGDAASQCAPYDALRAQSADLPLGVDLDVFHHY